MTSIQSSAESEIKSWLEVALKDENLKDFSVTISGNSEKGDGYMGDIVFVTATGIQQDNSTRRYNLVLKCSKRSQALREKVPIKEVFLNEFYLYNTVLSYFFQFQQEKGIQDPFNSIPKCYGSYISEDMEVIVFEDLKSSGYELWPKKQPLTRKHINLVIKEYGKFHATSVALQYQRPNELQKFVKDIDHAIDEVFKANTVVPLFENSIEQSAEILKNDLDEGILQKWRSLKKKVTYISEDMIENVPALKVILHGDCWNNNFMYVHEEGAEKKPLKVAFLDWQISRYSSPIIDLSYFLFGCISGDELQNLNDILKMYHNSFVSHLKELGMEDAHKVYPLEDLFNDWKLYSKYGIMMASLLMKIVSTEKDEVLDTGETVDSGEDFAESFLNEIRDKDNFRKRLRPIVDYAVKNNLI